MTDELLPEDVEPQDNTKWWWIGVGIIVLIAIVLVALSGTVDPDLTRARVRHVLIAFDPKNPTDQQRALDLITSLKQRIAAGEDLGTIAEEYSDDPSSRATGGDLGYAKEGAYVKEFEAYIWSPNTPLKTVSDIIQTTYGYHLVEVLDRQFSSIDQYKEDEKRRVQENAEQRAGEGVPPAEAATPAQ